MGDVALNFLGLIQLLCGLRLVWLALAARPVALIIISRTWAALYCV
jgi:hypothetical protein